MLSYVNQGLSSIRSMSVVRDIQSVSCAADRQAEER